MHPSRRPLIAGNWKMNAGGADGCELAAALAKSLRETSDVDIVIAPPATALAAVSNELNKNKSSIAVAGQNMHPEDAGAFTGEISSSMLKICGATWVILGHSERRQLLGESDGFVRDKVAAACRAEIRPIVCVGETLDQREAGQTLEVVAAQVRAVTDHLGATPGYGVVAYEPIWAIGTGKVASPEDAQQVHGHIRGLLNEASPELATSTRILYGGSMKPNNAEGLLSQQDIDGGLIGGAALKAGGFTKIAEIAQGLAQQAKTH